MKNFVLIIVIFSMVAVKVSAQNDSIAEQNIYLNHIALFVSDLKKSTSFYENVIQLKQIPEPFKDGLHTWFTLGTAGQIHLIQSVDANIKRNKHDHVCFSVRSTEAFVERLKSNNISFMNWTGTPNEITTRVDGVKQVFFQDPDGHWIEVNDDFPGRR
jgi:lactoylglutathione lyase